MTFTNNKMAAFKASAAPDRALTQDEMRDVRRRAAAEWSDASLETKEQWTTVHQAAVLGRVLAPLAAAAEPPPAAAENLWAGLSAPSALVPAELVVQEYKKRGFKERDSLANHEPALFVAGPVVARAAEGPQDAAADLDPDRLAAVASCWESKKNVCRRAVGADRARLIDTLRGRFSRWADDLGDAAQHCSGLLRLQGCGAACSDPMGPSSPLDIVVLLVLYRKQPKMQVFARCFVEGAAEGTAVCPLGPVPFHVQLRSGPSPLCGRVTVLDLCTSDELALELTLRRSEWHLVPLVFEETTPEPSLVRFCVVGRGTLEEHRVRQQRPARAAADLLEAS